MFQVNIINKTHQVESSLQIKEDQNQLNSLISEQTDKNMQEKQRKKDGKKIKQEWNEEELEQLIDLYKEFGPSWSYLSTKLQNKSYRNIKNKFNNGLRKAAKILFLRQGELYKNTKKSIKYKMLISLMNFVFQLEKVIKQSGFQANYSSRIFSMRSEILNLALLNKQFSKEMQIELIKLIKSINFKIRCFGVFKIQNNKKWKLTASGLKTICQADPSMLLNNSLDNVSEERSQETVEMMKEDLNLQSIILSQFFIDKTRNEKVFYEDFMSMDRQFSCFGEDGLQDCHQQSHLFY